MSIFGPSKKELEFRKALQLFSKWKIENCQILSVDKTDVEPCDKPASTDNLPAGKRSSNGHTESSSSSKPLTTEEQSSNVHPESGRSNKPVTSEQRSSSCNAGPSEMGREVNVQECDPDNRQTKRMKLHNPATEPYDCSPGSSIAPSSPTSYLTALDNVPVTSRHAMTSHQAPTQRSLVVTRDLLASTGDLPIPRLYTLRNRLDPGDRASSRDAVTSRDNVTSRDSSPETFIPDSQQPTPLNTNTSRRSRLSHSGDSERSETGTKTRPEKRKSVKSPQRIVTSYKRNGSPQTNQSEEPTTSKINRSSGIRRNCEIIRDNEVISANEETIRKIPDPIRRIVHTVQPDRLMSNEVNVSWDDYSQSEGQFTENIRRMDYGI